MRKLGIRRQVVPYRLSCGIHTAQIIVDGFVDTIPEFETTGITKTRYKPKIDKTSIILNLNHLCATDDPTTAPAYIASFAVYQRAFNYVVLETLKIRPEEYKIVRCDLRLDSENPDFFPTYQKLHRYIIQGMRAAYNVKNDFRSTVGQKPQDISASIRCSTFQLESYDKRYESDGRDTSAARFELRSVGRYKDGISDIIDEFTRVWIDRLQKAADALKCPDKAFSGLVDYMKKNDPEKTLSRQITRYADYIYSIEQIADINDKLNFDVEDVRSWAAVWKARHHSIRLYSNADIQMVIDEISRAMKHFFADNFEMFEAA